MSGDDLPIKVYEGEPSDVAFLISLLASTGIEVVRSGPFFGSREIHVRRSDEPAARELVTDFDANRSRGGGRVLPWPKTDSSR